MEAHSTGLKVQVMPLAHLRARTVPPKLRYHLHDRLENWKQRFSPVTSSVSVHVVHGLLAPSFPFQAVSNVYDPIGTQCSVAQQRQFDFGHKMLVFFWPQGGYTYIISLEYQLNTVTSTVCCADTSGAGSS